LSQVVKELDALLGSDVGGSKKTVGEFVRPSISLTDRAFPLAVAARSQGYVARLESKACAVA
jgi:hypothetical protein